MTYSFRRPRLSVDITQEQDEKLSRYLDHGMRKQVFGVLVEDLIRLIEAHGESKILGLLITRSIGIKELSKLDLET